jgi:hypothetical protein
MRRTGIKDCRAIDTTEEHRINDLLLIAQLNNVLGYLENLTLVHDTSL